MSNYMLYEYCKAGDLKAVENEIKFGATNYNIGLRGACEGGNMTVVELMLKLGANNYNNGLTGACYNGNMSIVKLMLKHGATEYNSGLWNAFYSGNMQIYKVMADLVSTNIFKYYDYKHSPYKVILLLETGFDLIYLKNINGYDILISDLNNFKKETKASITQYLLDPIIDIINSYSLL